MDALTSAEVAALRAGVAEMRQAVEAVLADVRSLPRPAAPTPFRRVFPESLNSRAETADATSAAVPPSQPQQFRRTAVHPSCGGSSRGGLAWPRGSMKLGSVSDIAAGLVPRTFERVEDAVMQRSAWY